MTAPDSSFPDRAENDPPAADLEAEDLAAEGPATEGPAAGEPASGLTGRRVRLVDVAARAGVSVPLVSIVMRDAPGASDASRLKVRRAAAELGYRPDRRASLLRRTRTHLIGVSFGVHHAFHGDLVAELYRSADDLGYELALSAVAPGRDEERAVQTLLQDRCEGLILIGPQLPDQRLTELARQLPVAVIARDVPNPAVGVVRTDDAAGIRLAVDHLVGLGHRRIAHVHGGSAPGAAERLTGYRDAMHDHGLDHNIVLVPGGLTEDEGAAAAHDLLRTDTSAEAVTAVCVFNDRCAIGFLNAVRDASLHVPRDLSVVGFDDSRLASLPHVNLTSVGQDTAALAGIATAYIEARTRNQATVGTTVVSARLEIRSTTGVAKQS